MEAGDIERYLDELGAELNNRGLKKPVRSADRRRIKAPICQRHPFNQRHRHLLADEDGLQRAYAPLRESVQVIKQKHDLDADWLNYLAQMLMYDEVIVPDGKLWKRFGPLHVSMHLPGNTFLPLKSRQDVTKTLMIVLYCFRKHAFAHASKHSTW